MKFWSGKHPVAEGVWVILMATGLFLLKFDGFILNPFEYEWLLIRGSDVSLDFLAWIFYLQSPWTFPIGMLTGFAHPASISIVATSALGLFALPAKSLGHIFDLGLFQYFGPWIFLCCLLQGLLGWVLLREAGIRNPAIRVLGTGFFLLAPCWLDRRLHMSLFGHWVVLLALYMYFAYRNRQGFYPFLWWGHAALSVLVHPYFVVFSIVLAVAGWWKQFARKRLLKVGLLLAGQVAVLLLILFVTGYFHTLKGDERPTGFGLYSANLNTFFNAQGRASHPFLDLPTYSFEQYEGFAYLGLGGLVLVGVLLVALFGQKSLRSQLLSKIQSNLPLLTAAAVLLAYSLSHVPTFFSAHLLIPLPENVLDWLSIFRSSGRFIWVPFYLLVLTTIWAAERYTRDLRIGISLLGICLLLQFWDVQPLLKKDFRKDQWESQGEYFDRELARAAIAASDRVITYPPYQRSLLHPDDILDWVYLAGLEAKPITAGYFARFDDQAKKPLIDSLAGLVEKGNFQAAPRSLWIIQPELLPQFYATAEGENPLRLFLYWGYGFGFGPEVEIPPAFTEGPASDSLEWQVVHLVDFLKDRDAAYLLVSVQDDASHRMDDRVRDYFRDRGSRAIDSLGFRESWAAVFGPEGLVHEKAGASDQVVSLEVKQENLSVRLESAGAEAGNFSRIERNTEDLSVGKRGLNVVLLNAEGEVTGLYNFDTFNSSYTLLKNGNRTDDE